MPPKKGEIKQDAKEKEIAHTDNIIPDHALIVEEK